MICTDNTAWAERAKYLTTQAKDDPVEYVHNEIGYNYRLTNLQAAMGCAQLEQLPAFIEKKKKIEAAYVAGLDDVPGLRMLAAAPWARSIFWMPTVLVDRIRYGCDSRELLKRLRLLGIQARPLWQPAHLNKPYIAVPRAGGEVAEKLHADALSLPCSTGFSDSQQTRVIAALNTLSAGAL